MSQPIEYRDVRAFSQSSLKLLDFSVTKFYREEYLWVVGLSESRPEYSSDAMTLGSMVDVLLTRPKDFDKEYMYLSDAPTGQMKDFIDEFHRLSINSEDDPKTIAEYVYNKVGFKRDKLETVIAKFQAEGLVYYNALSKSVGKTIVPQGMMLHAKALVDQMLEDEFIGPILTEETDTQTHINVDTEVYNQLEIYWEEHGLKFKALLDKVIVDHLKKTIQPYDIKTTRSSDFNDAFGGYRYDLQGAFYTDALHHWMEQQGLQNYEILPFVFIVAFTNEKGIGPQMWQMGTYDYYAGRYGIARPRLRRVRGYQTIVNDLLWHIKEDKWKYPKEVYLKKGIRELNYYIDDPYKH